MKSSGRRFLSRRIPSVPAPACVRCATCRRPGQLRHGAEPLRRRPAERPATNRRRDQEARRRRIVVEDAPAGRLRGSRRSVRPPVADVGFRAGVGVSSLRFEVQGSVCASAIKQCALENFRGRTAQEQWHTVSATRPAAAASCALWGGAWLMGKALTIVRFNPLLLPLGRRSAGTTPSLSGHVSSVAQGSAQALHTPPRMQPHRPERHTPDVI